ncbi:MAG: hypothetical protein K940chlam6_01741 [Chlamydiae bacterium]|nr:hypothetical protein [Chlamydiota bacterium]
MSVESRYFKMGIDEMGSYVPYYHLDQMNSKELCHKIAGKCRSNAFFERVKSVACIVATLATAYLAFLVVASFASAHGLFTTAIVIVAVVAAVKIASQYEQSYLFFLPFFLAPGGAVLFWSRANHYRNQAHLADLRAAEIQEI